MKTAGKIDGLVSFKAGQFAWCPALNETPIFIAVMHHTRKSKILTFDAICCRQCLDRENISFLKGRC